MCTCIDARQTVSQVTSIVRYVVQTVHATCSFSENLGIVITIDSEHCSLPVFHVQLVYSLLQHVAVGTTSEHCSKKGSSALATGRWNIAILWTG